MSQTLGRVVDRFSHRLQSNDMVNLNKTV